MRHVRSISGPLRWFAIDKDQALTFDFNGYKTKLDSDFAVDDARDNKILSLAATSAIGIHSFIIAHHRSTASPLQYWICVRRESVGADLSAKAIQHGLSDTPLAF